MNPNRTLCMHLRTKKMYLPLESEPDYGTSSTSVFWCIRTFDVVGKDDCPVCAEDCRDPRRPCYENDHVPAPPKAPVV